MKSFSKRIDKKHVFTKQVSYIKNDDYKISVNTLLELVPNYFFKRPASVTGKYHPSYTNGEGGLVRHTKSAIEIAHDLLNLEYYKELFTPRERDLLIISLLFHDTFKSGKINNFRTVKRHPLIAASFIRNNQKITKFSDDDIKFLVKVISSHMGEWAYDKLGRQVLPKPNDKYDIFVHQCDFLASRKFLIVNFDENGNIKR